MLIDYIFSVVNISKFKYKILKTQDDLPLLTNGKFYMSGNYTGSNCLMVFTKNKDRYYSFLVERKTLSYNKSQINIDQVSMIPIELGLEETIYDGTIIDGILSQTGDSKIYVITDVYIFRGNDMTQDNMKNKLINIREYLKNFLNPDKKINSIAITVNNLYNLVDIKNFVDKIIPHTTQLQVRGIDFYPDISGTKLIYMFNKIQPHRSDDFQEMKHSHNKYRESQFVHKNMRHDIGHNIKQKNSSSDDERPNKDTFDNEQCDNNHGSHKQIIRYVCKNDEPVVITFELRKTEQYDVYKLLLVAQCDENGRTLLKTKKYGYACIPTIECSKLCRDATLETGKSLMKCTYNSRKEKWIPVEIDSVKKIPDYVSTLEQKMDIIIDN